MASNITGLRAGLSLLPWAARVAFREGRSGHSLQNTPTGLAAAPAGGRVRRLPAIAAQAFRRSGWVAALALAALAIGQVMTAGDRVWADGLAMIWVFFAATLSSTVGFAFSPIAGAVLLHLVAGPVEAVTIILLCSISIQLYTVIALWRTIVWSRVLPFLGGGFLALPAGLHLLISIPLRPYQLAIGTMLVLYGACIALRSGPPRVFAGSRLLDAAAGAMGGITGGLAGFPGALVTIWCGMRGWDKGRQRAVYQPYILIMQLATLGGLTLLDGGSAPAAWPVEHVPGAVLGACCGLALFRRMSERQFDRTVCLLLVVSGIVLILN